MLDRPLPDRRALARISVIATDVDGTLLEAGQPVSARVREAVDAVLATGAEVVPVTGRPLRWMAPIAQQLPALEWAICANGSAVLNLRSGALPVTHGIDLAALTEFRERLHRTLPQAVLAYETPEGSFTTPGFLHDSATELSDVAAVRARATAAQIDFGDEASLGTILKVLVRIPGGRDSERLLRTLTPIVDGALTPTHSNPDSGLIEIGPAGVTKAHTLEQLTADRGLTRAEVAAFGDMPNDVEMLLWAGAGFAMAEGHRLAQQAADYLAPEHSAGGIAPVLEAIAEARSAELG